MGSYIYLVAMRPNFSVTLIYSFTHREKERLVWHRIEVKIFALISSSHSTPYLEEGGFEKGNGADGMERKGEGK